MIEETLILGDIVVIFEYERRRAEPEVGYMLDYWWWDIKSIELCNDTVKGYYELLNILNVQDLSRIDDEIEKFLEKKL